MYSLSIRMYVNTIQCEQKVNMTHQKQAKIIKADRNEIAANSLLLLLSFGFQKASQECRKFLESVFALTGNEGSNPSFSAT
jgi:hypothetical protein